MKKIFSLMIAIMAIFTMSATAQTVQPAKFLDNTAVTVKGGVSGLVHPGCNGYENLGHTLQAEAGLDLEKWITPAWGVGVEGETGFTNGSKFGNFQSKNWVNYVSVMAQAKTNLGNLILGYKGEPRTWEFIPTVGFGWIHGFNHGTPDENNFGTKFNVDVKYNVTERIALVASPYLAYRFDNNADLQPKFDSRNAWYGLDLGFSVRLGDNFKICPYQYTQRDVDLLNEKINYLRGENDDLRNRKPEVVEKVVEKTVTELGQYTVTFAQGSAELTPAAKSILDKVPAGKTVTVIGTTSPEGSTKINSKLSEARAAAVADYLKNRGVHVASATGNENGRLGVVTVEE